MPIKATTATAAAGIDWAVANGASVIDVSCTVAGQGLDTSIANAMTHGVPVFVCAGGVTGRKAIRVTAFAKDAPPDPRADVAAESDFTGSGGDSSATAAVSGIAGLMLSCNPALTPSEIRHIMAGSSGEVNAYWSVQRAGCRATPPAIVRLMVRTRGHGTVTRRPDDDTYNAGSVLVLRAKAKPHWRFARWDGLCRGQRGALHGAPEPVRRHHSGLYPRTLRFTRRRVETPAIEPVCRLARADEERLAAARNQLQPERRPDGESDPAVGAGRLFGWSGRVPEGDADDEDECSLHRMVLTVRHVKARGERSARAQEQRDELHAVDDQTVRQRHVVDVHRLAARDTGPRDDAGRHRRGSAGSRRIARRHPHAQRVSNVVAGCHVAAAGRTLGDVRACAAHGVAAPPLVRVRLRLGAQPGAAVCRQGLSLLRRAGDRRWAAADGSTRGSA